MLFVIIKLTQLAQIRAICREIDPDAFMIIHDVNDVFGRGFTLKGSGADARAHREEFIAHIEDEAVQEKK